MGRTPLTRVSAGFLLVPGDLARDGKEFQVQPYQPQPGDIILYDNDNKLHHFVYKLANTESPMHTAMVIARDDGTPALLELTGPIALTAKVVILDVEPRLSTYPGTVMVRRVRQPLTPEQSRELTHFAQLQVGKRFAAGRIFLQATPLCVHAGWRRDLFGKTYLNRNRWFCSEMVVAAGTCAHVFDPEIHKANATYPRDLAFDDTMDLSQLYHSIAHWVGESPKSLPVRAVP
jgi:hypothetical protein